MTISAEDFVKAYMKAYKEGKSYEGLAEEIGVSRSAVSSRAIRYRELGVDLPRMKVSRYVQKVGVEKLNKIISDNSA